MRPILPLILRVLPLLPCSGLLSCAQAPETTLQEAREDYAEALSDLQTARNQLQLLARLRDQGLITREDYDQRVRDTLEAQKRAESRLIPAAARLCYALPDCECPCERAKYRR